MSIIYKFVLFQCIIIVPFITGIYVQRHIQNISSLSKKIIKINLVLLEPVIVLWSVWGLTLSGSLFLLPLFGVIIVVTGFLIGQLLKKYISNEIKGQKTFVISISLANHGFTMGGFVCYIILGEPGLAYSMIFISYFMIFIYTVIFPYARTAGNGVRDIKRLILTNIFNVQNMPIYAMIVAIALLACGIRRINVALPVDAVVMVVIALYYFTLGTNFDIRAVTILRREHLFMAFTKFIIIPALVVPLILLFGLPPQITQIIVIQSFMPAAVYSVVSAILFDLDSQLASGMFVVNTVVFIVLILPLLLIFRNHFFL